MAGKSGNNTLSVSNSKQPSGIKKSVILKPGRSLMDWIRLGHASEDLTSVGGVGKLKKVTMKDLGEHNKVENAWTSIRGKNMHVSFIT